MGEPQFAMTIGGKNAVSEAVFPVVDPSTGRQLTFAPDCTKAQLDLAVNAARSAQPVWAKISFEERCTRIVGLASVIRDHFKELQSLLQKETGKTTADAAGELNGAIAWLESARTLTLPVDVHENSNVRECITTRVPLGVVGAILPWNYPVMTLIFKLIPALMAGNTLLAKPSPYTPITTLRLGELFQSVLPSGAFNVVTGRDPLGQWLVEHAGVDKIAFTGSTVTGKRIARTASDAMKRVSLELGGNDPAIVFADADIELTAEAVFWAAFKNNGQICVATKRLYVHADIYDVFLRALLAYASTIKIGDGGAADTQIGPLQNLMQLERVIDLVSDSRQQGHKLHVLGKAPSAGGYFHPLVFVDNPPDNSRVVVEEAFGPVLPVQKFASVDEVVARANNTPYGLGASVWTKDIDLARSVSARLQCGTVWINAIRDSPLNAPTAGHKQSGLGAENGAVGLLEYTNVKTVSLRKT